MGKPYAGRIALTCQYGPCSQPFSVIPSKVGRAKYCSRQCQVHANAALWSDKAAAMRITRICAIPECGKAFTVKPSDAQRPNVRIYCSRACQGLGAGPQRSQDLATRFWAKVAIAGPDECWPWQAGTFSNGYGKIWVAERKMHVGAHVVSWFLHTGEWPEDGINVCHSCDTPPCVNYNHLWLGTQHANIRDAATKGHMNHTNRHYGDDHWTHRHPEFVARGERTGHSKLTDLQWQEALALYATGEWTQTRLAQRYGVSQHAIWSRLNPRRQRHNPTALWF